jgi:hypothetical protein
MAGPSAAATRSCLREFGIPPPLPVTRAPTAPDGPLGVGQLMICAYGVGRFPGGLRTGEDVQNKLAALSR